MAKKKKQPTQKDQPTKTKKKIARRPASPPHEVTLEDNPIVKGAYVTSTKREALLYIFPYETPQGEPDVGKLLEKFEPIKVETFGRRRPSLKQGWWRLNTGDWARRHKAIFFKNEDGTWQEAKIQNSNTNDLDRMGTRPSQKAREQNIDAPAEENILTIDAQSDRAKA